MKAKPKFTLLVCPPVSKPCEPDPSVVALAGGLNERGLPCAVIDSNLTFHENLLSGEALLAAAGKLEGAAATSARRAAGRRGGVLSQLREEATWKSAASYSGALGNLAMAYKAVSRATGAQVSASDYVHATLSPLNSAHLALAADDPSALGTFSALDAAAEEILAAGPEVVAVSVTYLSQALHSWALAGLLRRKGYQGLLVVGGALIGSWAGKLSPASPALKVWDAAVVGPGERFLAMMAATDKIPDREGVLAPKSGIWNPAPDSGHEAYSFSFKWEGLRWRDYAAPGGILPLAASRGCYWSRCAFCPEAGGEYRAADAETLARSLLAAREAGGPGRAHFTDNALSPAHLKKLAANLNGERFPWYGFARVEKKLVEPGFMDKLASGGCAMLQLGIETATPRLLKDMGKGATVELADRVVRAASEAGIRVFGYFLFGMPTETGDEARATLDWIRGRADYLTCLNLSIMNLPAEGVLAKAPLEYGLSEVRQLGGGNDLSLYLGYSGADTIERREIRKILGEARKDPALRKLINRSPRGFTSNHAAFMPL